MDARGFINTGLDARIISAINAPSEGEELSKALDKRGLVQKEITVKGKNGTTFTRKQWVRATDAAKDDSSKATPGVDLGDGSKAAIAKALASGATKDQVMQAAKAAGITWKENNHPGINWMRASMAIQKANLSPSVQPLEVDKPATDATPTESEEQPVRVFDMIDWVGQSAGGGSEDGTKKRDVLTGITTQAKSKYEQQHFDDIIKSATPEQLRDYRTLGMGAGDDGAAKYLKDLYEKYSKAINGGSDSQLEGENDVLKNKLSGVVNKMVVDVCRSSLSNIRQRVSSHTKIRDAILYEPWVDPNHQATESERDTIFSSNDRSNMRTRLLTETDLSHKMLHKVLDKFKESPEYADVAKEYDEKVTAFDEVTQGIPEVAQTIQDCVNDTHLFMYDLNNTRRLKDKKVVQKDLALISERLREQLNKKMFKHMADAVRSVDWAADRYYRSRSEGFDPTQTAFLKERYDLKRQNLDKLNKWAEKYLDPENPNLVDDMCKIAESHHGLNSLTKDSAYLDLNANLYHYRQMGKQLAFQWDITKDFVDNYPVLSSSNLDLLENKDTDTLTNLAMHAGLFKPSLAKKGDPFQVLQDKYTERQQTIAAYGGVKSVAGNTGYAEDNELRCRITTADAATTKRISDQIAADWDRQAHGSMRYKIKGVFEVSGLEAESDFNKIKQENDMYDSRSAGGKNCQSDMFYHGTGSMATSLILGHSGQFKIVKAKVGRMLGDGIYLADKSSKSAQYIGDTGYTRHRTEGSLMICEASLGHTDERRTRNSPDSYNSVYAGKSEGLLNNEWCVKDPKAVIPRYLVQMELR